jgi:hypothetical protein
MSAVVPLLVDKRTLAGPGGRHLQAVPVPAGTPKEIVALLHREIVKAVASPEVKERFATLGFEVAANTPEEFGPWSLSTQKPDSLCSLRVLSVMSQTGHRRRSAYRGEIGGQAGEARRRPCRQAGPSYLDWWIG